MRAATFSIASTCRAVFAGSVSRTMHFMSSRPTTKQPTSTFSERSVRTGRQSMRTWLAFRLPLARLRSTACVSGLTTAKPTRSSLFRCNTAAAMAAAALLSGCIAHELPVAGSSGTTPSLRVPTTPQAYRVLHRFGRSKRVIGGYHPAGLLAYHGTLYGTAHDGGKYGYGTVYSITPPGALHVVYSFGGTQNDGFNPSAGVIAVDGVLYGVTDGGGACGAGTVFTITTSGAYRVMHRFGTTKGDGFTPTGSLA